MSIYRKNPKLFARHFGSLFLLFFLNIQALKAANFDVIHTKPFGEGSFYEAISRANARRGADRIVLHTQNGTSARYTLPEGVIVSDDLVIVSESDDPVLVYTEGGLTVQKKVEFQNIIFVEKGISNEPLKINVSESASVVFSKCLFADENFVSLLPQSLSAEGLLELWSSKNHFSYKKNQVEFSKCFIQASFFLDAKDVSKNALKVYGKTPTPPKLKLKLDMASVGGLVRRLNGVLGNTAWNIEPLVNKVFEIGMPQIQAKINGADSFRIYSETVSADTVRNFVIKNINEINAVGEASQNLVLVADECVVSNVILITVTPTPIISIAGSQDYVCIGGTTDLTAVTTGGNPSCVVKWQTTTNGITWTDIAGATGLAFTPQAHTTVGVYRYRAVFECLNSGCDAAISNVFTLNVNDEPLGAAFPNNVTECVGGNQLLTLTITGGAGVRTYQWQTSTDGVVWSNIAGATASTYLPPSSTPGTTYYRALITFTGNDCALLTSASSTVEVMPKPTMVVSAPSMTCSGESVVVSAVVNDNGNSLTMQWQQSADGITWANIPGATSATFNTGVLAADRSFRLILFGNIACGDTSNAALVQVEECGAEVGNYVWEDTNGNGIQDASELGIANVSVTITGTTNRGGTVTRTLRTSATGFYLFDSLPAGTYTIQFGTPTGGYTATAANRGGNDEQDSDADPSTGRTASFTLVNRESNMSFDAGFYRPARLGDYAWLDCNKNGMQDVGERPLAGIAVSLTGQTGIGTPVTLTTTTDAGGQYAFTNLAPGTYTVNFAYPSVPTGLTYAQQGRGSNRALDSDIDGSGNSAAITLVSNQTNNDIDAGFVDNVVPTLVLQARDTIMYCGTGNMNTAVQNWLTNNGGATATDNASTTLTWTNNFVSLGNSCGQAMPVTFTVTDECGNMTTTTANVIVRDTVRPVLSAIPTNVTVNCNNVPNAATITATDNCSATAPVTMNEVRTNGSCSGNYTLTRTWTATDDCGNTSVGTQTITVQDLVAPVLANVPTNVTVECGSIPLAAAVTATDNCDVAPRVTVAELRTNGSCSGNYTLTRTWTATDACGNTTTASQRITVQDNTAPVLAGVPSNVTVDCNGIPAVANVDATDNCDSDVNVAYTETRTNGTCAGKYTLTRTWVATDSCGNRSTGTQIINVDDVIAPTFVSIPSDVTVACGSVPTPPSVSARDNCDAAPAVAMTETRINAACGYSLVRTWTATDVCGNTATASQRIIVEDRIAPVMTGVPTDVTVPCNAVPIAASVTVTDNCDASPSVAVTETRVAGTCVNNFTITRTWTASDACGNTSTAAQIITVRDTVAPAVVVVPSTLRLSCADTANMRMPSVTTTDNCTNTADMRLSYSQTRISGACAGTYRILRVWSATDACGNRREGTQEVTVEDTTPPTMAGVPTDISINCGQTLPTVPTVTAVDNCGTNPTVVFAETRENGSCTNTYTVVRRWTATDDCGNAITSTQRISVSDTTAPVFASVPQNITLECGQTIPTAVAPAITDNCDANPTVTFAEVRSSAGTCPNNYTLTRTWTATDACGNRNTAIQVINVEDRTAPTIAGVRTEITIQCTDPIPTGTEVTVTDNCDAAPRLVMSDNILRGVCGGTYTIVRTFSASDICGNTSTAIMNINVIDTVRPVLANIPANLTLACGQAIPAPGLPRATDNCDANPRITLVETRQNGACAAAYTLTRTWTARDACGNTSSASQTIEVGDRIAPVLAGVPTNVTLACGQALPTPPTVTATDNCDAAPTVTMADSRVNGACAGSYTIVRTWTARDACGNTSTGTQQIVYGDNEAPTFANVPANLTIACGGSAPVLQTPSVSDRCDANPRVTFNETREDGFCAQSYTLTRTWTATDACGNSRSVSQVLTVGDRIAPVFANVPTNVTISCTAAVPTVTTPRVTDNCDANPRVSFSENRLNGACAGNYAITRTWTATDACGNVSTASQRISVEDRVAPVLANIPSNISVACGQTPPAASTTVSATDNCDNAPRISFNETRQAGTCGTTYSLIRTWTATDACGNTATGSQTVTVGDLVAPVFANVPANLTLGCGQTVPTATAPTVTDNCDATPRVVFAENRVAGTCAGNYNLVRTWTATDACGNTATATQNIMVGDTTAPVFANVPTTVNVNCGGIIPAVVNPTISDVCDANPRLTLNETREAGTCASSYRLIRTWTATDACGNTRTASQIVNVGDTEAPVLVSVPTDITLACGQALPNPANLTVTDNCDAAPRVTSSDNRVNGTCAANYVVTRTFTVTDACGNTTTAVQRITVGDTEVPVFANVPRDISVGCTGGTIPSSTPPSVSDNCDSAPRVVFAEIREEGSCANSYVLVRSWTATDACGNTATARQRISVGDNTPPTLVGVPQNVTLGCTATLPTPATVTATDLCDARPRITSNDVIQRGVCAGSYTVIRTWTATDACGNFATASQVLSVGDNQGPVFANVPQNVTVGCNGTPPAATTPTITDNCDAAPRLTFAENRVNGTCTGNYRLVRTWTATDACGNTSTARQEVTVGDTEAPVLANIPQNITIACNQPLPTSTGVTATDLCDAAPRVAVRDSTLQGLCAGSYDVIRIWTATDACGNNSTGTQRIAVRDTVAPIFANVPNNITVGCTGTSLPVVQNPTITDNCDANPRLTYAENRVNGTCTGSYNVIRTWTATDACGNTRTVSQVISVGDNEAPVFANVPANVTVGCTSGNEPAVVNPTVTDNCTQAPTIVFNERRINGTCANSYRLYRTWTATDACGNSRTASQVISIGDTEGPVLAGVPQALNLSCGQPLPAPANVTATDACSPTGVQVAVNDVRQDGACAGNYAIVRTWTATDACGNTSTGTQLISYKDTIAPVFANVPQNLVLGCNGGSIPTSQTPSVTDNCDANPRIAFSETRQNGICATSYTLLRTWTATDACGNTRAVTQRIAIGDTEGPTLVNLPQDVTFACTSQVPNGGNVTARDNCDAAPRVTISDNTMRGTCSERFITIRTWTATDACGNTATASRTITVNDTIAPVLVNVPQNITVNLTLGETVPLVPINVTAVDNCTPPARVNFSELRENGTGCSYVIVRRWIATDNCGNTSDAVQRINVVDGVDDARVASLRPENCQQRNGSAILLPTSYTYTWSDGRVSSTRNDLAAGTYQVTATKPGTTCAKVLTVVMTSECGCTPPTVEVIKDDVNCAGRNGAAMLNVTGADLSELRFTWTPSVSTTNQASNLSVGEYAVRVEYLNRPTCFAETRFRIEAPTRLEVADAQTTIASCSSPTGTASFTVPAGADYRFRWSDGDTNRVRTALLAGTYQVTVSDLNNPFVCPAEKLVTVSSDNPLRTSYAINRQPRCGEQNGSVTLTTSGGSGQYVYSWGEGNSRHVLPSGPSLVTVTDVVTGCKTTVSFTLTNQIVEATLLMDTVTTVSCFGATDGRINYVLTPGLNFISPARIEVRDMQINIMTNGALAAGNYSILAKDSSGCTVATRNFRVKQPDAIVTTSVARAQTCDALGSIAINATGGTGNFTYSWSDLVGQPNQARYRENLMAGTYTITVSDAVGCQSIIRNVRVSDSCICRVPVLDSVAMVAATCGQSNGSATIALVGGGESRYSFDWTPSTGTSNAIGNAHTNLAGGIYTVFVSARNNASCSASFNIGIGSIEGPRNIAVQTNPAVCQSATGTARLTAPGDSLTYLWLHDNSTAFTRSDLRSGVYQVMVTKRSAPDCPSIINVRVEESNPLQATGLVLAQPSCGASNGSATIRTVGASSSLTYSWGTSATRQDLRAGVYNVTVTDNTNNCRSVATFTLENLTPSVATITMPDTIIYTTCNGVNNGRINYSVSYGTSFAAPATVEIINRNNIAVENGTLSVGSYCVVIKDRLNCVVESKCFEVRQPLALRVFASKTNKTCTEDGRISLTVSGGSEPYSYNWSDLVGQANQPAVRANLSASTYYVTVTDARGCAVALDTVIIRNECPNQNVCEMVATVTATDRTCTEGGSIRVLVSRGTAPFRFTWSDLTGSDNPQNRYQLGAGNYTVVVIDANNCRDTIENIIIRNNCQPNCIPPTLANFNVTNARCGQNNGEISVTATENTGLVFRWSPAVSDTNVARQLAAGTYRLKVCRREDTTCYYERTFVVGNENGVEVGQPTIVASTCAASNARVEFPATGRPLTYTWSDGGSGSSRNNLSAGTYSVTVEDPSGAYCAQVLQVVVPSSNSLTATVTINRRATCGQANGSATIRPAGGSGSYVFSWGTSSTRTDLRSGNYTVTVTDARNGCTAIVTVGMTDDLAASASINLVNNVIYTACAASRDAAVVYNTSFSSGFVQPARYEIRNTNGGIVSNGSLGEGRYIISVFDGNGCLAASSNFEVRSPAALVASSSVRPQTCTDMGNIALTVSGGSGIYTYAWSNGQTTPSVSGLVAGTYSVTVSDARGCQAVLRNIEVVNNAIGCNTCITTFASANVTPKTCVEGGKINIITSGGTAPYTFTWSDLVTTNQPQNRINLQAGTYAVTVTDARGCRSEVRNIQIIDNCQIGCNIAATTTTTPQNCTTLGTVSLNVTGGVSPYSYIWSNGMTTASLTAVRSGNYAVTITDGRNCRFALSNIFVRNDSINCGAANVCTLAATATPIPQTCDDLGRINLTITGGRAPFRYQWSNNQQNANLTNIQAGVYGVTIIDSLNCRFVLSSIVVANQAQNCGTVCTLSAIAAPTPQTCSAFGTINLTVTGGTMPYRYTWSNGTTTANQSGLRQGTYSVTVTDTLNCRFVVSNIIVRNDSVNCSSTCNLAAVAQTTPKTCTGFGKIELNVIGGVAPFTFTWSNGSATVTPSLLNLNAGSYGVTITDSRNCQYVLDNITVGNEALNCNTGNTCQLMTEYRINTTPSCGVSNGNVTIIVSGGSGRYGYNWSDQGTWQNVSTRSNLAAGSIRVIVYDSLTRCKDTLNFNLIENTTTPAAIVVNQAVVYTGCRGEAAVADFTVAPAGVYVVTIKNVATNAVVANGSLYAGQYRIEARDANGCLAGVAGFEVRSFNSLEVTALVSPQTCNARGGIIANVAGGAAPYNYAWSNGQVGASIAGIVGGGYGVTVTDARGCVFELGNIVVRNDSVNCGGGTNCTLAAVATAMPQTCSARGGINVTVTGGASPFGYAWSNGATTRDITGLVAGNYGVTVTDARNCRIVLSDIAVRNDSVNCGGSGVCTLAAVFGTTPQTCTTRGTVTLTVSGGTLPYNYVWSNGATVQNLVNAVAGNYSVTITDANMCRVVLNTITVRNDATNCNGNCTLAVVPATVAQTCTALGSVNLTVTGGTLPYSYVWNTGATGRNIGGVRAGTYAVTVTDSVNCRVVLDNIVVRNDSVNCSSGGVGSCNLEAVARIRAKSCTEGGSIVVTVLNGSGRYGFDWVDMAGVSNAQNRFGLMAGNYTVYVLDSVTLCRDTLSNLVVVDSCSRACATVPSVVSVVVTAASCGQANGSILVESGGVYTYTWTPAVSTTNIASNLQAGTYKVRVSELTNGQCYVEREVVVGNRNAAAITASVTAATCGAPNGAVTLNGGQATWTYAWSDGGRGMARTDLASGTYSVTATNPSLPTCPTVIQVVVPRSNGTLVGVATVVRKANCGQANGIVQLSAVGGSGNYTFSNGVATINNLASGTFRVTVTDNMTGCQAETQVVMVDSIATPVSITVAENVVYTTCIGASNATVNYTASATSGYTIVIKRANNAQVVDNGSLGVGNYIIEARVTSTGCLAGSAVFEVRDPQPIVAYVTIQNKTCTTNGSIAISATGGTGRLLHDWLDILGVENLRSRSNLVAGLYGIRIADANNCETFIRDIRVVDECNTIRPRRDTFTFNVMVGRTDSFCVPLDSVFLTRSVQWGFCSGGNPQTLNFGTTTLLSGSGFNLQGCFKYAAGATMGRDQFCLTSCTADGTCDTSIVAINVVTNPSACRSLYLGSRTLNIPNCSGTVDLCLDIPALSSTDYVITDNNQPLQFGLTPCAQDTLFSYTYFSLTRFYPSGPYTLDGWNFNGRRISATIRNINALVDSMNRWDPLGNWRHNVATYSIIGGSTQNTYGDMTWKRNNRTIATFRVNRQYVPSKMSIRLDTGVHFLRFYNRTTGCPDSFIVNVNCNPNLVLRNTKIDTLLYVGDIKTVCLPQVFAGNTTITNVCPQSSYGYATPQLNDITDCITFTGARPGRDTFCYRRCYSDGRCDTTTICVTVKSFRTPSDTGCIAAYTGVTNYNVTCGTQAELCTNLLMSDTVSYRITNNGQVVNSAVAACSGDTVFSYTYFTLTMSSPTGPWKVDAWTVGSNRFSGTFASMTALVDSMNRWDNGGNWLLNPTLYSIKGGRPGVYYGNMVISKNNNVVATFTPNRQFVGNRLGLRLAVGTHNLRFENLRFGCSQDVTVTVTCTQRRIRTETNTRLDTIVYVGETLNICRDSVESFGASQTTLSNVCNSNTRVNLGINDATDCISIMGTMTGNDRVCIRRCNLDGDCDTLTIYLSVRTPITRPRTETVRRIDTVLYVGQSLRICRDSIESFGASQTTLTNICNANPNVNVAINDATDCTTITGTTIGTDRVCIKRCNLDGDCDTLTIYLSVRTPITRPRTETVRQIDTILYVGESLRICRDSIESFGASQTTLTNICNANRNVNVAINDATDCITITGTAVGTDSVCIKRCNLDGDCDTLTIYLNVRTRIQQVAIPRPIDIVERVVREGKDSVYCLNTSRLTGNRITVRNICEPNFSDNVNFIINGTCITYFGDRIGKDTACLVMYNEFGSTDTVKLIVQVIPQDGCIEPPKARTDRATTATKTAVQIEALRNDSTCGIESRIEIVQQGLFGTATVNKSTGVVTYRPYDGDCEGRDSIRYALCNAFGCDSAWIHIEILCEDIVVFSGFSPNGDGVNETFTIVGIDKFDNNRLLVFNRWGSQVLDVKNYKNDWNGVFNNKPVPDGTYFWILDLGNGTKKSGYVQIHR